MIQGLLFEKHAVTHPSQEPCSQCAQIISLPNFCRDLVDVVLWAAVKGEIQFICSLPWDLDHGRFYTATQNDLNLSKIDSEETQREWGWVNKQDERKILNMVLIRHIRWNLFQIVDLTATRIYCPMSTGVRDTTCDSNVWHNLFLDFFPYRSP